MFAMLIETQGWCEHQKLEWLDSTCWNSELWKQISK